MSSRISRIRTSVFHNLELNDSSVASLSGDQSSLGLLQDMLGQVEADLDTLCPDTLSASAQSPKQHGRQGLTGFSVALVSTLGRLVHLLKQVRLKIWEGVIEETYQDINLNNNHSWVWCTCSYLYSQKPKKQRFLFSKKLLWSLKGFNTKTVFWCVYYNQIPRGSHWLINIVFPRQQYNYIFEWRHTSREPLSWSCMGSHSIPNFFYFVLTLFFFCH